MKISSFFPSMPTTTRILRSSPPPPPSTNHEPLLWSSDLSFVSDHSDPLSFIFNNEEEKEEPLLARKNNSFPSTTRKEKHCFYNQPSWSTAAEENYPMTTTTPPPWFHYTVDDSLQGGYYSDMFEADQNPVCDFTSSISESRKMLNSSHFSSGGEVNEGRSEKVGGVVVASSSLCSENTYRSRGRKRGGKGGDEKEESEEGNSDYEVEEEDECVGGRKGAFSAVSASVRVGSGSKRSRAAEVHNLSERRRRDRINEKMKALQELIPNCNKVDKASMLDEAIEYLKTLQLQVQMMAVGTGMCMPPLMFHPGAGTHFPYFNFGMADDTGNYGGSGMVDMGSGVVGGQLFQSSLVQGPHQGHSFMSHGRMMGEPHVHLPSHTSLPNSTPQPPPSCVLPLSLVHTSQGFIHGGVEASNCGIALANKNMGFHGIDIQSVHGTGASGDVIHMSCQRKNKGYSESDLVKGRC